MSQTDTINQNANIDRSSVVTTLDEIIRSFDNIENLSNNGDQLQNPEHSGIGDSDSDNHHVLDLVQEYATHTSDILRELRALRKALPATYFKNRSKIRDAFDGLEQASGKCKENAYAILDALQSGRINSRKSVDVAAGLGLIKARLSSLLQSLEGSASEI